MRSPFHAGAHVQFVATWPGRVPPALVGREATVEETDARGNVFVRVPGWQTGTSILHLPAEAAETCLVEVAG